MLRVRVKGTKDEGIIVASFPVTGHFKVLVALAPKEGEEVGKLAEYPSDQLEFMGIAVMQQPPPSPRVVRGGPPIDLSGLRGDGR